MKDNSKFWDRYAKIYDYEIKRFNSDAYKEMYHLMAASLSKEMNVLEVATGTGLIALNISKYVRAVEAVDYSIKMVEKAKKKDVPKNVNFTVADAKDLLYEENSFDAVVISNALHIIGEPETVLKNISRVLKPKGLLIAPTFTHGHISDGVWKRNTKLLSFLGLGCYTKRTPSEYVEFIDKNGFTVLNWRILNGAFPLVYLEAENSG